MSGVCGGQGAMSGMWEDKVPCQVCGKVRHHVRYVGWQGTTWHGEGEAPCQVCWKARCHVRCGDEDRHVRCVCVGRGTMSGVWGK